MAIFGFFMTKFYIGEVKENRDLKKDTAKLNLKVNFFKEFNNKLQTAATETETFYQEKMGFMSKEYQTDLTKLRLMLLKLQNKPSDTVLIMKESDWDWSFSLLETTIDSLKTSDLALYYNIEVLGQLKGISFKYTVYEKTVTEKKIIYDIKYIDKPVEVWTPKRHLYCIGGIGIEERAFSLGLLYTTKKRLLLGISYDVIILDDMYKYWKVKVGYQLF